MFKYLLSQARIHYEIKIRYIKLHFASSIPNSTDIIQIDFTMFFRQ